MKAKLRINEVDYSCDLSKPLDISIPLKDGENNPAAWYIGPPRFEPVVLDNWTGSVAQGGAVNFFNIKFNPHAHGTHTECLGHISLQKHAINEHFDGHFSLARLVTIEPLELGLDQVIGAPQLAYALKGFEGSSVVIRTLPNTEAKRSRNYNNSNWPYLNEEAALLLRNKGIEHLLIDLPSVDQEEDGGALAAHRAFWNYPDAPRLQATITELIYVPDAIKDGDYLLNLQVAPFHNDAAPSRPVLFALQGHPQQ